MPQRKRSRYDHSMPLQLGAIDRLRTAWHVLRHGDYKPASDYLRGHRHGLDAGIAIAWAEFQHRHPQIGQAPVVPK